MTHVTCRLTAKNRDQLRNPTLGNRVWASFTFFTYIVRIVVRQRAEFRDAIWEFFALRRCYRYVRFAARRKTEFRND